MVLDSQPVLSDQLPAEFVVAEELQARVGEELLLQIYGLLWMVLLPRVIKMVFVDLAAHFFAGGFGAVAARWVVSVLTCEEWWVWFYVP